MSRAGVNGRADCTGGLVRGRAGREAVRERVWMLNHGPNRHDYCDENRVRGECDNWRG